MSVRAEVPQESAIGAIGAKPAVLGHGILGACRAQESRIEEGHPMPDHVHQEMANKQVDQMQLKPRPHEVSSLVPKSFITASGGSPSNPQLCWGLLAT
jgi:hypothetical protein